MRDGEESPNLRPLQRLSMRKIEKISFKRTGSEKESRKNLEITPNLKGVLRQYVDSKSKERSEEI